LGVVDDVIEGGGRLWQEMKGETGRLDRGGSVVQRAYEEAGEGENLV
jgi:hypothetical protein